MCVELQQSSSPKWAQWVNKIQMVWSFEWLAVTVWNVSFLFDYHMLTSCLFCSGFSTCGATTPVTGFHYWCGEMSQSIVMSCVPSYTLLHVYLKTTLLIQVFAACKHVCIYPRCCLGVFLNLKECLRIHWKYLNKHKPQRFVCSCWTMAPY